LMCVAVHVAVCVAVCVAVWNLAFIFGEPCYILLQHVLQRVLHTYWHVNICMPHSFFQDMN